MREIDLVHFLVELNPELKATYELYQSLLTALNRKDPDAFLQACLNPDPLIFKPMNTVCFPSLMREIDLVHFLVELNPELKATYELYQSLLTALNRKDPDAFLQACLNPDPLIFKPMNTAIQSLMERKEAVVNALTYSFSNGMIEGTNNLISSRRLMSSIKVFLPRSTEKILRLPPSLSES